MDRRNFLKSAGASVATLFAAGAASGADGGDDGVLEVSGVRIHRFTPDGDEFEYEEQFRSGKLRRKFGTVTVTVDEARVPRELLDEKYRDRENRFQITQPDTAVVGHLEDFVARETAAAEEANVETHTFPLYAYKSADAAERSGPLNVGWDVNMSAGEIRTAMRDGVSWWAGECWCADLPSFDRYAVVDGDAVSADSEVAKSVGSHVTGSQWHARLWDLPDGRVVAQAHYDVQDHGWVLDPDYRFSESRRTVRDTWTDPLDYSSTLYYQGNGSGYTDDDSSNGYLSLVN